MQLVIHITAGLGTKKPDQTFKSGDLRPRHWSRRGARGSALRSVPQWLVPDVRRRSGLGVHIVAEIDVSAATGLLRYDRYARTHSSSHEREPHPPSALSSTTTA